MPSDNECLPSGNAALELMRGNTGALPKVVGTILGRGVLVASGLYLAGARGKKLTRYSLYSVGAIEAFVLAWAAYKVSQEKIT